MVQFLYAPILRWKQGERAALAHLSSTVRTGTTPHLVVAQGQYGDTRPPRKPSKKPPKKQPPSAADALVKQIADAWGSGKFYLDASDLPGTAAAHCLDNIAVSARAAGLKLVPSTKLNAPAYYQAAAQRMVAADGRGSALRISLAELTSAGSWIGSWYCPVTETDLIIDLAGSVGNVSVLGTPVAMAFASLYQGPAWRSVTMAGGNIPANLGGYPLGQTPLPRVEVLLWNALNAHGLPYTLHFGDYATIGPDASTDNIPGPVPINAKYTLNADFLVFHGVKTKGPGARPRDAQYRSYAKAIVGHPSRGALGHCWGDTTINAIATIPSTSPGSPASWVSYSVNRHIELTRSQLP